MGYLIPITLGLLIFPLFLHTLIRIIRHFYKFPMPQFFASLIDNPLRRRIQPPEAMPFRHGIQSGMKVLEVGPGNGTYTVATAQAIGETGREITIDIEPKMIKRVMRRIQREGVSNIAAMVADVFNLPFEEDYFDLVYMIAVIGEIPTPEQALKEFFRVLSPLGRLVFSEIYLDPDYPRSRKLVSLASKAGFQATSKLGNFFSYTLIFEKKI
jgi:ubiquinone/menaquinone biosynthesis C-methylase UbiE